MDTSLKGTDRKGVTLMSLSLPFSGTLQEQSGITAIFETGAY